ncbi:hypothetical protein EDD99_5451 [Streptomyces sp. 846.5]|nr:hypothetical protein EDD99_5451 [Streptomyces sp. 846.5]
MNEGGRTEDQGVIYVCDAHYRALQHPYSPDASPE